MVFWGKCPMNNANIDALYAGSLRINVAYVFSELFSIYKWCVTKVAFKGMAKPASNIIFPQWKSFQCANASNCAYFFAT